MSTIPRVQYSINCSLCGCNGASKRCSSCNSMSFCDGCDVMYHRHPKRRSHIRESLSKQFMEAVEQSRKVEQQMERMRPKSPLTGALSTASLRGSTTELYPWRKPKIARLPDFFQSNPNISTMMASAKLRPTPPSTPQPPAAPKPAQIPVKQQSTNSQYLHPSTMPVPPPRKKKSLFPFGGIKKTFKKIVGQGQDMPEDHIYSEIKKSLSSTRRPLPPPPVDELINDVLPMDSRKKMYASSAEIRDYESMYQNYRPKLPESDVRSMTMPRRRNFSITDFAESDSGLSGSQQFVYWPVSPHYCGSHHGSTQSLYPGMISGRNVQQIHPMHGQCCATMQHTISCWNCQTQTTGCRNCCSSPSGASRRSRKSSFNGSIDEMQKYSQKDDDDDRNDEDDDEDEDEDDDEIVGEQYSETEEYDNVIGCNVKKNHFAKPKARQNSASRQRNLNGQKVKRSYSLLLENEKSPLRHRGSVRSSQNSSPCRSQSAYSKNQSTTSDNLSDSSSSAPEAKQIIHPKIIHSSPAQKRRPLQQSCYNIKPEIVFEEPEFESETINDAGEWSCRFCTFINSPNKTICEICAKTRLLQSDMKTREEIVKLQINSENPSPTIAPTSAECSQPNILSSVYGPRDSIPEIVFDENFINEQIKIEAEMKRRQENEKRIAEENSRIEQSNNNNDSNENNHSNRITVMKNVSAFTTTKILTNLDQIKPTQNQKNSFDASTTTEQGNEETKKKVDEKVNPEMITKKFFKSESTESNIEDKKNHDYYRNDEDGNNKKVAITNEDVSDQMDNKAKESELRNERDSEKYNGIDVAKLIEQKINERFGQLKAEQNNVGLSPNNFNVVCEQTTSNGDDKDENKQTRQQQTQEKVPQKEQQNKDKDEKEENNKDTEKVCNTILNKQISSELPTDICSPLTRAEVNQTFEKGDSSQNICSNILQTADEKQQHKSDLHLNNGTQERLTFNDNVSQLQNSKLDSETGNDKRPNTVSEKEVYSNQFNGQPQQQQTDFVNNYSEVNDCSFQQFNAQYSSTSICESQQQPMSQQTSEHYSAYLSSVNNPAQSTVQNLPTTGTSASNLQYPNYSSGNGNDYFYYPGTTTAAATAIPSVTSTSDQLSQQHYYGQQPQQQPQTYLQTHQQAPISQNVKQTQNEPQNGPQFCRQNSWSSDLSNHVTNYSITRQISCEDLYSQTSAGSSYYYSPLQNFNFQQQPRQQNYNSQPQLYYPQQQHPQYPQQFHQNEQLKSGLEIVQTLRDAERKGYSSDDVECALQFTSDSPIEWLDMNWRSMCETVHTLTNNQIIEYTRAQIGNGKKTKFALATENDAKKALREAKGDILTAVERCFELVKPAEGKRLEYFQESEIENLMNPVNVFRNINALYHTDNNGIIGNSVHNTPHDHLNNDDEEALEKFYRKHTDIDNKRRLGELQEMQKLTRIENLLYKIDNLRQDTVSKNEREKLRTEKVKELQRKIGQLWREEEVNNSAGAAAQNRLENNTDDENDDDDVLHDSSFQVFNHVVAESEVGSSQKMSVSEMTSNAESILKVDINQVQNNEIEERDQGREDIEFNSKPIQSTIHVQQTTHYQTQHDIVPVSVKAVLQQSKTDVSNNLATAILTESQNQETVLENVSTFNTPSVSTSFEPEKQSKKDENKKENFEKNVQKQEKKDKKMKKKKATETNKATTNNEKALQDSSMESLKNELFENPAEMDNNFQNNNKQRSSNNNTSESENNNHDQKDKSGLHSQLNNTENFNIIEKQKEKEIAKNTLQNIEQNIGKNFQNNNIKKENFDEKTENTVQILTQYDNQQKQQREDVFKNNNNNELREDLEIIEVLFVNNTVLQENFLKNDFNTPTGQEIILEPTEMSEVQNSGALQENVDILKADSKNFQFPPDWSSPKMDTLALSKNQSSSSSQSLSPSLLAGTSQSTASSALTEPTPTAATASTTETELKTEVVEQKILDDISVLESTTSQTSDNNKNSEDSLLTTNEQFFDSSKTLLTKDKSLLLSSDNTVQYMMTTSPSLSSSPATSSTSVMAAVKREPEVITESATKTSSPSSTSSNIEQERTIVSETGNLLSVQKDAPETVPSTKEEVPTNKDAEKDVNNNDNNNSNDNNNNVKQSINFISIDNGNSITESASTSEPTPILVPGTASNSSEQETEQVQESNKSYSSTAVDLKPSKKIILRRRKTETSIINGEQNSQDQSVVVNEQLTLNNNSDHDHNSQLSDNKTADIPEQLFDIVQEFPVIRHPPKTGHRPSLATSTVGLVDFGWARTEFECELCANLVPLSETVTMLTCTHYACRDCLQKYFTVQIRERQRLVISCPFCDEPSIDADDDDRVFEYLALFDPFVRHLVDEDTFELYQRKTRDRALMRDPNFIWCPQCSSGFISPNPCALTVTCPDCRAITCRKCRQPWKKQHFGIGCEEFARWAVDNDQEFAEKQLTAHLKEFGIECPNCKFQYQLAKGGCMHFRCLACSYDFCGCCSRPFKPGNRCFRARMCASLGLHAHHPRNCLFYLRDKTVADLEGLLKEHSIDFRSKLESKNNIMLTSENNVSANRCQVMEQKESESGRMKDEPCSRLIESGGLCRMHYKEYLGTLIYNNHIDPITIFTDIELELVLRRENIRLPNRTVISVANGTNVQATDTEYRTKLIQLIDDRVPLNLEYE